MKVLLEKRLVSCCQLSNISSSYHCKGNIEVAEEYIVKMKSKKILYKEILKLYRYEVPQIVMYNIQDGYTEITIGVEMWNKKAMHIYKKFRL